MTEQEILKWCGEIVRTLEDGGIWALPSTRMVYRIDKTEKTLTLLEGTNMELHQLNINYFGKVGYKVLDGRPQTNN